MCKVEINSIPLSKLHTTELGVERIRKNLSLGMVDVVEVCRAEAVLPDTYVTRKGKNWYIHACGHVWTVNAGSNTIITAHRGA